MTAMRAEVDVKGLANDRKVGKNKQIRSDRRAWTIKGIKQVTVEQSREAAQRQGMLLSLWVEKQLREAAERELRGNETKNYTAEMLGTKIENIESALHEYLQEQDKKINKLQEEIRMLNNTIVPPLLDTLAARHAKKGGR